MITKNINAAMLPQIEAYEAPVIEIVEVKVEQGFANSLPNMDDPDGNDEHSW